MERRLAAILAADVVGYCRLMGEDEAGTLERLKSLRRELVQPKIAEGRGRIVKLMGDGLLAEFPSVVEAVQCAVDLQNGMNERECELADDERVRLRIGINLGDIIVEGSDIYGDGVNVAARLEGLAETGGICISSSVFDQVQGKIDLGYEFLGKQSVKNIAKPVRAYKVLLDPADAGKLPKQDHTSGRTARWPVAVGLAAMLVVGGGAYWWTNSQPEFTPANVYQMALALPDKPSIAVLPFTNMSGDPEQEYFADGMTEDLITDLSKLSGLFVIARNSSFSYKDQQVKVGQVAEELGVRYVLEGSVRRAGDQVRINAQLIDAITGGHIWAERYDGTMENVFALQDNVTRQIVAALTISLTEDEQIEYTQVETDSPEAYNAFLRGWEFYHRNTPEYYAAAIPFFEKAIKLDPDYGRAHAALAAVYWNSTWRKWSESLGLTDNQTTELARINLRKAMKKPTTLAHRIASERYAYYRRSADKSIEEAERAISLDANDPSGYLAMANALIKAGRSPEAIDSMHHAMRLDPHYPVAFLWRLGRAQFSMEAFKDAASTFERAANRNPEDDWVYVYLVASYGQLGMGNDAKAALVKANTLRGNLGWSELTLENYGFGKRENSPILPERALLREGLEMAGLKDGRDYVALITTKGPGEYEVKGATGVDVVGAQALLDREAYFVDLHADRFAKTHIPGAHALDYDYFNEVRLLRIARKTDEIVIYSTGNPRYTAVTCARAVTWGFEKVYCFYGGFDGWTSAGYPVQTGN